MTTPPAISPPAGDRVLSVDVFRALTILGMIFVNELGQGFLRDVPAWLRHAPADVSAMTVADLVFPAFLFIVGLAIPLALDRRRAQGWPLHRVLRHIVGRTFGLLVLGVFMVNLPALDPAATGLSRPVFELLLYAGVILVLNRYPDAHGWRRVLWLAVRGLGIVLLVLLARQYRGTTPDGPVWLRTQWWGILGLIGWAYLVSSLAYLATRGAPAGLMGVLGLLVLLNIGDRCGALAAFQPVREYIFLGGHIGGHASLTVAGMLVAVLMGLGGARAGGGSAAADRGGGGVASVFLLGLGLAAAGWLLDPLYGISKVKATPTWCLYSAALCTGLFLLLYFLVDRWRWRAWARPLQPVGANPLLAYILPDIVYAGLAVAGVKWLEEHFIAGGVAVARAAVFAALMAALTAAGTRVRIRLAL